MGPIRQQPGSSPAWRAGYLAAMIGLGDQCPYPGFTVDAIEWEDGHTVAMRLLQYLYDA